MLPQLARHPRDRVTDVTGGLYAFVLGLFFKAVIADHISDAIDPYWTDSAVRGLSTLDAWCVALLYSAQIFADFGGYSFMAIGLGKILGFELPTNFDAPYLAASFQEFWHRWHMTLSSFLRDYLFIGALGGSRVAAWRIPVNLIVTMLLGGLWHGPAWNFIAWGGLHGCALAIERSTGFTMKERRGTLARGLWFGAVFLTVLVAWVLFRSPDLRFAIHFLGRMAGLGAGNGGMRLAPEVANAIPLALPVLIYHLARTRLPVTALWQSWAFRGIVTGALSYVVLMAMHSPRGFIYFVF
jgi:alginate O-acetyltransferase complex protein AlgI